MMTKILDSKLLTTQLDYEIDKIFPSNCSYRPIVIKLVAYIAYCAIVVIANKLHADCQQSS